MYRRRRSFRRGRAGGHRGYGRRRSVHHRRRRGRAGGRMRIGYRM